MSATLPVTCRLKWHIHIWRFGAMFSVENVGEKYGQLGSVGREYHLSVWKNPR